MHLSAAARLHTDGVRHPHEWLKTLLCLQVRDRKARQARSSVRQPMLPSAYSEQPQWTPSRLIRTVVITLISGVVAGIMPCSWIFFGW